MSTEQVLARPVEGSPTVVSRLPRVLYVVAMDPSQKFGSMEEQTVFLASSFQKEGGLFLPLFNYSGAGERPTPLERAGVEIATLDMERFQWHVLLELLSLIGRHRIDIVHWNFSSALSNSYVWWLTLLRPRVAHFYTDHSSRYYPLPSRARGWRSWLKRILLARYARVLCVSQFVFDCLQSQDVWANLVCCRHFVNTDRFRPDPRTRARVREELHARENHFVVLVVAHLIKDKGVDVALRALARLPDRAVLWVIGAGEELDQLRALTGQLGLGRRVAFLGPQSHVEQFMAAADCLVCPSVWAEAAGLVNLEAQSCGLPVVASNVGGIPEYVEDGRTGFLFPPGDAEGLACCVRRLLEDPALRERLGRAAHDLAERRFSPAVRLPDFLSIYRSSRR